MRIPVQAGQEGEWQIRPPIRKRDADRTKSREAGDSGRREKPLLYDTCPYRKPTQVDEERILRPAGEALPRNSAKWPCNFGRKGARRLAAENRPKQLFSKNTGLCEAVRRSIRADACPVLEGYEERLARAKL